MGGYTLVVEDRFGQLTDEYSFDSGEIAIGRSRECEIVLNSENVSRKHAKVSASADGIVVEDLRSANGVFVNGDRIEGPRELKDQDVLRVGDFHLHVRVASRDLAVDRPVHARLVGRNLVVAGQTFEITSQITLIGRGKDCGLVLVDGSVSRVHARLLVRPDQSILVEDVGSANGVFVNDQRVKVWQLAGGDLLRLGNVEFLVDLPGSDTPARLRTPGWGAKAVDRLPWILGGAAGIAFLAILAVAVPPLVCSDEGTVQQAVSDTVAVAEPTDPAPKVEVDHLARARELLLAGKVEEAAKESAAAVAADPANPEAVKMANRIDQERAASRSLAAADAALKADQLDQVVQALMQIPPDSHFAAAALERFQVLAPRVEALRDKACKPGRTIKCIQLRALSGKISGKLK